MCWGLADTVLYCTFELRGLLQSSRFDSITTSWNTVALRHLSTRHLDTSTPLSVLETGASIVLDCHSQRQTKYILGGFGPISPLHVRKGSEARGINPHHEVSSYKPPSNRFTLQSAAFARRTLPAPTAPQSAVGMKGRGPNHQTSALRWEKVGLSEKASWRWKTMHSSSLTVDPRWP